MEISNKSGEDVVYETNDGGPTEDKPPFDKLPEEVRRRLEELGFPEHVCTRTGRPKHCAGRLKPKKSHKPTATEEEGSGPWNVTVIVDPENGNKVLGETNVHWSSVVHVVPTDVGEYDLVVERRS